MASFTSTQMAYIKRWIRGLLEHVDDVSNPHHVMAAQVGAYSIAEVDALRHFGSTILEDGTTEIEIDITSVVSLSSAPRRVFAIIESIDENAQLLFPMVVSRTATTIKFKWQSEIPAGANYLLHWEVIA